MSERLVELLRQRALLQQQLADLDRQIAEEAAPVSDGRPASPQIPEEAMRKKNTPVEDRRHSLPASSPRRSEIALSQAVSADPETILNQYVGAPDQVTTDVRKGCFLYLTLAIAVLALGVFALLRFLPHTTPGKNPDEARVILPEKTSR